MAANNNKFIEIVEGYFEEIANFGSNSEKARASSIKSYKITEAKYEKLPEFRLMIDGLINIMILLQLMLKEYLNI